VKGPLCAEVDGFSLHAGVRVEAGDRRRLEHLCPYACRPAIADSRLTLLPDGRVGYALKRRWQDGTVAVVMEPQVLMEAAVCVGAKAAAAPGDVPWGVRAGGGDAGLRGAARRGGGGLPIALREAFVLFAVESLPYAEITAITGVAAGTLQVRVHRAKALLSQPLGTRVHTWWSGSS
jgi:hypothetical protein